MDRVSSQCGCLPLCAKGLENMLIKMVIIVSDECGEKSVFCSTLRSVFN
jgi:hypothetical protein